MFNLTAWGPAEQVKTMGKILGVDNLRTEDKCFVAAYDSETPPVYERYWWWEYEGKEYAAKFESIYKRNTRQPGPLEAMFGARPLITYEIDVDATLKQIKGCIEKFHRSRVDDG